MNDKFKFKEKKLKHGLQIRASGIFLCSSILFLFCMSGVAQVSISTADKTGFGYPMPFSTDSAIYFCAQYITSYERRIPYSHDFYYEEPREMCTCKITKLKMLEWNIKNFSDTIRHYGIVKNEIFIWNKEFINYIIQEFRREKHHKLTEEALKMLEYAVAHSDDNTFTAENIIDFDNKVIINDKMYYYPLKIESLVRISVRNINNFYSMIPKTSWIFHEQTCFDDGNGMIINLLIPLLEETKD